MKVLSSEDGLTLVEVLIGLLISVFMFGSVIGSLMALRQSRMVTRHTIQALNTVRSEVERLRGLAFDTIGNEDGDGDNVDVYEASYDAGPDLAFDTADDFTGTVTVTVRDFLDMDGDGDADEAWIDIDDDGANDTVAKPVRVTFQWTEHLLGPDRAFTLSVDTLIAS
jgi:type II secretory pathway pseudopilin PulG